MGSVEYDTFLSFRSSGPQKCVRVKPYVGTDRTSIAAETRSAAYVLLADSLPILSEPFGPEPGEGS